MYMVKLLLLDSCTNVTAILLDFVEPGVEPLTLGFVDYCAK